MGRQFNYSGQQIMDKWAEYVEYMKTQVFERAEAIKSGERAGDIIYIPVQKPYTIESFCLFSGIEVRTYFNYLNGNSENADDNLIQSLTYVNTEIKNQQVQGGVSGMFNPMLVARINQITDNSTVNLNANVAQINLTAPGTEPIDFSK